MFHPQCKVCSEILALIILFEGDMADFRTKVDDRREQFDRF
jgi:hypothetical protein